jgi:spermidine synthase
VQDAPPVTDDHPLIEYADWVRPDEITRVMPAVMINHSPVPLAEDDPWQTGIQQERYNLWHLYKAELSLYQGEPDDWYEEITPILNADPDNPYYAWLFDASLSGGS